MIEKLIIVALDLTWMIAGVWALNRGQAAIAALWRSR